MQCKEFENRLALNYSLGSLDCLHNTYSTRSDLEYIDGLYGSDLSPEARRALRHAISATDEQSLFVKHAKAMVSYPGIDAGRYSFERRLLSQHLMKRLQIAEIYCQCVSQHFRHCFLSFCDMQGHWGKP